MVPSSLTYPCSINVVCNIPSQGCGWGFRKLSSTISFGPPSTNPLDRGGKNLSTLIRNVNHWMIGHRHLRCQQNPLEKNSNQNFAPDTKRPSKRSALCPRFSLCCLLLWSSFYVLVTCILVVFRWRIRKARTSTYPCIYGIYDIYILNIAFTFE